jgi:hypothetical protein
MKSMILIINALHITARIWVFGAFGRLLHVRPGIFGRTISAVLFAGGLSDRDSQDMPVVLNTRRARGESGKGTQVAQAVQEMGYSWAVFRVTDL